MAWKGVHLTNPARLSLAAAQLVVSQEDGETRLAIEDIAWVIIDNHQTTLSVALLAALAEAGAVVLTSDRQHMPSAVTLPYHPHHKQAAMTELQVAAGAPLKKRLWQRIIYRKIINQAAVLERLERVGPPLTEMANRVRSGDPDNIEAQAARAYWQSLFPNFSRGDETDLRNKTLNYGYAVVRGCLARAIAATGLIPALGLHHASQANAFNLVDDLIEPFRPLVDLTVAGICQDRDTSDGLTRQDRQKLGGLPLIDAVMTGGKMSLLNATEIAAQSLVQALEHGSADLLDLPKLSVCSRQ